MTFPIQETLQAVCTSIALNGSLARAAKDASVSESWLYQQLRASKREAAENASASPRRFEWQEQTAWLHENILRAKAAAVLSILYQAVEEQRHGIEAEVRNPSTGLRVQSLNPLYLNRPDSWFAEQTPPLDAAVDKYLWEEDALGGPDLTRPIFEKIRTPVPAAYRNKLIAGLLPKIFGDKSSLAIEHGGAIIHRLEHQEWIPRAQRPQLPIIEGEFRTLPPPMRSLDEQRADVAKHMLDQANAHLARPDRITKPQGAPVLDVNNNPLSPSGFTQPSQQERAKPIREDQADVVRPRPPEPTPPQPAPPSYARRPDATDAHRTNSKVGGNLVDNRGRPTSIR